MARSRWATDEYAAIMRDYLGLYVKSDTRERASIIKEIKSKIVISAEKSKTLRPEGLSQVSDSFPHAQLFGT
jgi:hypothetical protein